MGAGNGESEIPLLLTLFYLFRESEAGTLGVWDSIEERYRKRLVAWKT